MIWTLLIVGALFVGIGVIFAGLILAAGHVLVVNDPIEHPTRLEALRQLTTPARPSRAPWKL